MEVTKELKRRFCKNCNIPISLFEEPYFTNRLQLLDKQYDTMAKYSRFLGSIEPYKTEQEYYEHYNGVKDKAIEYIKSQPEYEEFNNMDMSEMAKELKNYQFPSTSIYKPSYDRMKFISIDMKHANFSSIRHFSPNIFGGAATWELFMRKFTNDAHILESKYVRQVILGNCNPKRHIGYEKVLMAGIFPSLLAGIDKDGVVFFSNDEIVIRDSGNIDFVKDVVNRYSEYIKLDFKVESFKIIYLGEDLGYMKLYDDMSYKLKCVDSDYVHMIIRLMECGEIKNDDLCFYYKHTLAYFDRVPECITKSKAIQSYHAYLVKKVMMKKLIDYFGINDEDGTYFYELQSVKCNQVSVDDFKEIDNDILEDLSIKLLEMEDFLL